MVPEARDKERESEREGGRKRENSILIKNSS